ncbi:hypothetical protein [Streptomyces sp. AC555_RSS877]|uniref:hypothetical protein n=1 Tax=Streptomyces sp. AC555_RSS877 TaxID=2823688 RepID=UPI001C2676F8|nr:hypothetical protein [Streptomyces sp. AC555_RSS877]
MAKRAEAPPALYTAVAQGLLWDSVTQQPLGGPFPTPGEPIRSLASSSDDTTLLVAGSHVPLHRYTVDPSRAVAEICARVGKVDLTRAEWSTYVPDAPYTPGCAASRTGDGC